jgi:hypothetical protein
MKRNLRKHCVTMGGGHENHVIARKFFNEIEVRYE